MILVQGGYEPLFMPTVGLELDKAQIYPPFSRNLMPGVSNFCPVGSNEGGEIPNQVVPRLPMGAEFLLAGPALIPRARKPTTAHRHFPLIPARRDPPSDNSGGGDRGQRIFSSSLGIFRSEQPLNRCAILIEYCALLI